MGALVICLEVLFFSLIIELACGNVGTTLFSPKKRCMMPLLLPKNRQTLNPFLVDFLGAVWERRLVVVPTNQRSLQTLPRSDLVECSGLVSQDVEGEVGRSTVSENCTVVRVKHKFDQDWSCS